MLALALLVLAQPFPAPAEQALRAAAAPEVRVELRAWRLAPGPRCAPQSAEVRGPVNASGWIPVRLAGRGCEAWAWAQVALFTAAWVVDQGAAQGEAVVATQHEHELTVGRGFLAVLPKDAVAARKLARGTVLEAQHLRPAGPAIGAEIVVVAQRGALSIAQRGRVIGCGATLSCAQLANGRRVEGTLRDGRLFVELQ